MIAAKIVCQGKVQGVFFRASAMEYAIELGIKGFVRNESNGDVYLEAIGTESQIDQLILWCHQGPDLARVEKVVVEYLEPSEIVAQNFSIQR